MALSLTYVVAQVVDPTEVIVQEDIRLIDVVAATAVLAIALIASGLVRRAVKRTLGRFPDLRTDFVKLAARIAAWSVILFGVVIGLTFLGLDTGPVLLALVVIGGVIFLSGRSLLENFGAGLILQMRSPFRQGDVVEIVGRNGVVYDVDGRTVVLDTPEGDRVFVPNSEVLKHPIINRSHNGAERSELVVGVEYGTDLALAVETITTAVSDASGVFADPVPEVMVSGFGDSSVDVTVWFWREPGPPAGMRAQDEVSRAIDEGFARAGIVIPFPQRVLWHGDNGDNSDQPDPH